MKKVITAMMACLAMTAGAETYDLTKPQPTYNETTGYGYDFVDNQTQNNKTTKPYLLNPSKATDGGSGTYFSVAVPDGNYRVTVTLGNKKRAGETWVRAEARRLMVEACKTKKGETKTLTFLVNKRTPEINDKMRVKIKPGEVGSMTWDEKLTFEFTGPAPCVQKVTIEPDTTATTVFLCGNSTVVDQGKEPWASWGQMIPRWFNDKVCVANYGESGLTCASFLAQNRLEKILSQMKKGDYVFVEFGHNDEKEKGPGRGAWYHYSVGLKTFIDKVRDKGGDVIFCTPTQRRFFESDGKTLRNTHGDFPAAMRAVAERERVPLIDLNASTKTLFETMGSEGSKRCLVHYPMGTFPWQEKKFEDNTHFNPFGAYEVAKLVVMGLKSLDHPLMQYITPDFPGFTPAHPDDWQQFAWPQSRFYDGKKPDGN